MHPSKLFFIGILYLFSVQGVLAGNQLDPIYLRSEFGPRVGDENMIQPIDRSDRRDRHHRHWRGYSDPFWPYRETIIVPLYPAHRNPDAINRLRREKNSLRREAQIAADSCRCFATTLERNINLFPNTPIFYNPRIEERMQIYRGAHHKIHSKRQVQSIASEMRADGDQGYRNVLRMLDNWPDRRNSREDIKELNTRVGSEIRKLSPSCERPFKVIGDEAYALSRGKVNFMVASCELRRY